MLADPFHRGRRPAAWRLAWGNGVDTNGDGRNEDDDAQTYPRPWRSLEALQRHNGPLPTRDEIEHLNEMLEKLNFALTLEETDDAQKSLKDSIAEHEAELSELRQWESEYVGPELRIPSFEDASLRLLHFIEDIEDSVKFHLAGKPLANPERGFHWLDMAYPQDLIDFAWWGWGQVDRHLLSIQKRIVREARGPLRPIVLQIGEWSAAGPTWHGVAFSLIGHISTDGIRGALSLQPILELTSLLAQELLLVESDHPNASLSEQISNAATPHGLRDRQQMQYELWAAHPAWSAADAKREYEKLYRTTVPSVSAYTKACQRWAKKMGLPALGTRRHRT
jgi:hypothetical protein